VTALDDRHDEVATLSIGQVLKRLVPEYPDVTISKIRFLEAEGLIEPERAASGYRKFREADVERLHYVLRAQRDHYLPLRVIKQQLSAMDRGLPSPLATADEGSGGTGILDPAALMPTAEFSEPADFAVEPPPAKPLRVTADELVAEAGISAAALEELLTYRLVPPAVDGYFDEQALAIAKTAGRLAEFGLQPRHLRAFRLAADREVGLFEQVLVPLRRHRTEEVADQARRELSVLSVRLHALLVKSTLGGS
jgi:DNA-binding transcriptional MerR regulator